MNSNFNKNFSSNFRRLFLLVAMTALLAAVFSGCMKKETPETPTETATQPPLLIEPEEETTASTEPAEPAAPEANIVVEGKMITISGAPVEVRSAAGPDGLVIGKLEVGTQAEVLRQVEFQDGVRWALVRDGWICLDNVDLENGPITEPQKPESVDVVPPATEPSDPIQPHRPSEEGTAPQQNNSNATGNAIVRAKSGLKIRSAPSTNSKTVGGLKNGARIQILEQKDGWGRVNEGWISMKYVSMDGGASVPNSNTNTNNNTNNNTVNNSGNAIVTTNNLNIRQGPGTDNAAVGKYNNGTRIEIVEQRDGWGRTKDGWVSLTYVYMDGSTGEGSGSAVVTGRGVNVRSGPGTGYKVVGSVTAGDALTINAQFQVGNTKWGNIKNGWVCMDYVKMN